MKVITRSNYLHITYECAARYITQVVLTHQQAAVQCFAYHCILRVYLFYCDRKRARERKKERNVKQLHCVPVYWKSRSSYFICIHLIWALHWRQSAANDGTDGDVVCCIGGCKAHIIADNTQRTKFVFPWLRQCNGKSDDIEPRYYLRAYEVNFAHIHIHIIIYHEHSLHQCFPEHSIKTARIVNESAGGIHKV